MGVELVWLYLGKYVGVKYTQEYYVCVGYTYNLQVRVEDMQEYYVCVDVRMISMRMKFRK